MMCRCGGRGFSISTVCAAALGRRYPGQFSKYSYPSRPGGVENLTGLRRFPRVLAGFTALLALAALANVLYTTLRRRRRELATLRSLGFTPRQIGLAIIWQGVSITAVGLAVGIPAGIAIGARVWLAATGGIGVATDASHPLPAVAAFSPPVEARRGESGVDRDEAKRFGQIQPPKTGWRI